MSKKKKIIVLSCMIALLVTTAVLNFVLSSSVIGGEGKSETVTTANYFSEVKTTKNTSRTKQLEQLNEIISANTETSAVSEALAMKLKLTEINEKENLLESLIKAYGYNEVAVTLGISSDNVSVIVRDANFEQDDAVLIYTVCAKELNLSPENVYIQSIS